MANELKVLKTQEPPVTCCERETKCGMVDLAELRNLAKVAADPLNKRLIRESGEFMWMMLNQYERAVSTGQAPMQIAMFEDSLREAAELVRDMVGGVQ